jgi:hypothetical protein
MTTHPRVFDEEWTSNEPHYSEDAFDPAAAG